MCCVARERKGTRKKQMHSPELERSHLPTLEVFSAYSADHISRTTIEQHIEDNA